MFDLNAYNINLTELVLCNKIIIGILDLSQFTNLKFLHCEFNQITELILPNLLIKLRCFNNKITKLNLPNSLTNLYCYNNQITELFLPNSLTNLDCSDNQITELILPSLLEILYCRNNNITELILPPLLIHLRCSKNKITELILPPSLTYLDCYNNNITKLDLPPLLKKLYCDKIYDFECTIKNINKYNKLKLNNSSKIVGKFIKSFVKHKKMYHPNNIEKLCNENGELDLNLLERQ